MGKNVEAAIKRSIVANAEHLNLLSRLIANMVPL